jgi:hypothetical protein
LKDSQSLVNQNLSATLKPICRDMVTIWVAQTQIQRLGSFPHTGFVWYDFSNVFFNIHEKDITSAIVVSIDSKVACWTLEDFVASQVPMYVATSTTCFAGIVLTHFMNNTSFLFCFMNESLAKQIMTPVHHFSHCDFLNSSFLFLNHLRYWET